MSDLTEKDFTLRKYYRDKYGKNAIANLNKDADFCNQKGDLKRRNRLLRVRDELILEDQFPTDPSL